MGKSKYKHDPHFTPRVSTTCIPVLNYQRSKRSHSFTSQFSVMAEMNGIKRLDLTISVENAETEAVKAVLSLRPDWHGQEVKVKSFTEGYINRMLCCYLASDKDKRDALVVRIYGDAISMERNKEFLAMQIAHAAGCSPPLKAYFSNGMIYGFAPGRTLKREEFSDPDMIKRLTRKLAMLHNFNPDSVALIDRQGRPAKFPQDGHFILDMFELVKYAPDSLKDPLRNERYSKIKMSLSEMEEEIKWLKDFISDLNLENQLQHNDFHVKNIIYDEEKDDINIIDFEMMGMNFRVSDIGIIFEDKTYLTNIGMIPGDTTGIDIETRNLWVRYYTEAKYELLGHDRNQITDVLLEKEYLEHRIVGIVMHFAWIAFSFGQLENENTALDFLEIGEIAVRKYYSSKKDLQILKEQYLKLSA